MPNMPEKVERSPELERLASLSIFVSSFDDPFMRFESSALSFAIVSSQFR